MLEQLKERYKQYEQDVAKVKKKAKPTDGLFGMGADPKKHPCHGQFYEDVESWMKEFLDSDPGAEEAADAAEWIIKEAAAHRESDVFWYMYAAQGLVLPLIGRMPPERCAALLQWYDRAYPPLDRMPVQKNVYKLLRKNAKAK